MPSIARRERFLIERYLHAYDAVVLAGFGSEVTGQSALRSEDVTETAFLRELAWVVLSCGLSERVVRKQFGAISNAFLDWRSASAIVASRARCSREAMRSFAHAGKISAILFAARFTLTTTFPVIHGWLREGRLEFCSGLPYLGPVSRLHLAKNLGVDVAKPDRHLQRIVAASGFESAQDLCATISALTGDRIGTVDLVLWRYATLHSSYEDDFRLPHVRPC